MDENPYKSPLGDGEGPRLVPLWRRILSLPLIIFGGCYLFAFPSTVIEAVVIGPAAKLVVPLIVSAIASAIGAGMLWSGLRLRRAGKQADERT